MELRAGCRRDVVPAAGRVATADAHADGRSRPILALARASGEPPWSGRSDKRHTATTWAGRVCDRAPRPECEATTLRVDPAREEVGRGRFVRAADGTGRSRRSRCVAPASPFSASPPAGGPGWQRRFVRAHARLDQRGYGMLTRAPEPCTQTAGDHAGWRRNTPLRARI